MITHAAAQVDGLADIDGVAVGIAHDVDPRGAGQAVEEGAIEIVF